MALKQIHSKKELDNFTEEQIVRDPNSDKIFIKDGDNPIVDESAGNTGSLGNTLTTSDAEHFNRSRTISKIIAKEVSKGAAQSGLNMAKQAGLSLFNPSNIRSAINAGGSTNLDIKDIYSATLDRISTAEQTRKEGTAYLSQMIEQNSKLWDSLTGEEVDYIKRFGVPSEMTLAKISQYKQEHPEEDSNFVLNLRNKFPFAGISSSDTVEQATAKAEQEDAKIRGRSRGSGPGNTAVSADTIAKLRRDNPDKANQITFGMTTNQLSAMGLAVDVEPQPGEVTKIPFENRQGFLSIGWNDSDISAFEKDVSENGFDAVYSGLQTDEERMAANEAYGIEIPFINTTYLFSRLPKDVAETLAEKEGTLDKFTNKQGKNKFDYNGYILDKIDRVKEQRNFMSEADIAKELDKVISELYN